MCKKRKTCVICNAVIENMDWFEDRTVTADTQGVHHLSECEQAVYNGHGICSEDCFEQFESESDEAFTKIAKALHQALLDSAFPEELDEETLAEFTKQLDEGLLDADWPGIEEAIGRLTDEEIEEFCNGGQIPYAV
jgi:predicted nucleic acid-binding Zn ribbon protein